MSNNTWKKIKTKSQLNNNEDKSVYCEFEYFLIKELVMNLMIFYYSYIEELFFFL